MKKIYTIKLDDFDLGQMLDGLEVRADAWEATARYLRSGESPEEFFIAEDCRDAAEAETIAGYYRRIIDSIRAQREAQETIKN